MTADAEQISHTPGPWRAGGNHIFAVTRDGLENWIASTDSPYVSVTEPTANANLIAAAPNMLSLLKELIDIEGPQPGTNAWAEKVRAAIAKAEGRDV